MPGSASVRSARHVLRDCRTFGLHFPDTGCQAPGHIDRSGRRNCHAGAMGRMDRKRRQESGVPMAWLMLRVPVRFLLAALGALLRWSGLTADHPTYWAIIAKLPFLPKYRYLVKHAIRSARRGKPWIYKGKNYRVISVQIENNYLVIRGYPLDGPHGTV